MSEKKQGQVKWFDSRKGFGFIEIEGEKDIFVHFSEIQTDGYKSLIDGEKVEFEIDDGEKGIRAKSVTKVIEK